MILSVVDGTLIFV